jgi:hypothetical protein
MDAQGSKTGGSVGREDNFNESFKSLAQYNYVGNPVDVPVPEFSPCPPRQFPPLPLLSHKLQDTGNNEEEVMTVPTWGDLPGALKNTEVLMKAQKTKNLSNKNKDYTSIAGAVVKLLERDSGPLSGMSVNMTMMFMQQLDTMNKSINKQNQQERNGMRKESKHYIKHQIPPLPLPPHKVQDTGNKDKEEGRLVSPWVDLPDALKKTKGSMKA